MVENVAQKQTLINYGVIRFISGYILGVAMPFIYVLTPLIIYFIVPNSKTSPYEFNSNNLLLDIIFYVINLSLISFIMNFRPKYFYLNFFILFSQIIPFYLLKLLAIEGNSDIIQTQEQIRAQELETFLILSLYSGIGSIVGMINPILLIKNRLYNNTTWLRVLLKNKTQ